MPNPITIMLYDFDELSEHAKERARDWYRQQPGSFRDTEVLEHAKTCAEILGIEIEQIYWHGFSYQGQGACFIGRYAYAPECTRAIKNHVPKDRELHALAQQLVRMQRPFGYRLTARTEAIDHQPAHEYSVRVELTTTGHPALEDLVCFKYTQGVVCDAMRNFMRWIYRRLEAEYDRQMSDACVDHAIRDHGYTFAEDGHWMSRP